MVGSGVGAKNGILFKTAVSLESTGRLNIVALDKTGTVTKGEPVVTDVIPNGIDDNELLKLAYSLENKSEHPLARAIVSKAEELGLTVSDVDDFSIVAGNGLSGKIDGENVFGGNINYISSVANIPENSRISADRLSEEEKHPCFSAKIIHWQE